MAVNELLGELEGLFSLTVAVVARAAAVYAELRRRGVTVEIKGLIFQQLLPKVADGRLAAEAVSAFADTPRLLQAVSLLPPADQRDLAAGKAVPVVTALGEAPVPLTAREIHTQKLRHVLVSGRVLDPEQQTRQLVAAEQKRPAPKAPAKPAAGKPAKPATEEEIEALEARIDAEVRRRGGVRLTPKMVSEMVSSFGWVPGHRITDATTA